MYILDRQIENWTRRRNHVYKGPIGTAKRASNPTKSLKFPSHSKVPLPAILPSLAPARVSPADQLLTVTSCMTVITSLVDMRQAPGDWFGNEQYMAPEKTGPLWGAPTERVTVSRNPDYGPALGWPPLALLLFGFGALRSSQSLPAGLPPYPLTSRAVRTCMTVSLPTSLSSRPMDRSHWIPWGWNVAKCQPKWWDNTAAQHGNGAATQINNSTVRVNSPPKGGVATTLARSWGQRGKEVVMANACSVPSTALLISTVRQSKKIGRLRQPDGGSARFCEKKLPEQLCLAPWPPSVINKK
jgi:hypothetical protein